MYRFAFIVVAAVCLGFVEANFYTDCGSKQSKLLKVEVTGCDDTQDTCVLHRGHNVTFNIQFQPNEVLEKLTTVVHGIMMNLPVPFPLSEPDACKNSGLSCPLSKDTAYDYHATMPVLKTYPKVRVDVKWELQDKNGADVVCILIPAKIQ